MCCGWERWRKGWRKKENEEVVEELTAAVRVGAAAAAACCMRTCKEKMNCADRLLPQIPPGLCSNECTPIVQINLVKSEQGREATEEAAAEEEEKEKEGVSAA